MHVLSDKMKHGHVLFWVAAAIIALGILALTAWPVSGAGQSDSEGHDWMFDPGPYSNDPHTGRRVTQYAPEAPAQRVPYDQYFSPDGPDPYGMYEPLDGLYNQAPYRYYGPYPSSRPY